MKTSSYLGLAARVSAITILMIQAFGSSFVSIGSIQSGSGESALSDLATSGSVVYAQSAPESYDLAVQKSVKSITDTSVIYRIQISEVNGLGVTQVSLEDLYASGLTYVGVVTSTDMFQESDVQFIHDEFVPKLIRNNMSIPAGSTEIIELEFAKEAGADIQNDAVVNACNNAECVDQYTNVFSSTSFQIEDVPYDPVEVVDLHLEKHNGICTTFDATTLQPTAACTNADITGYDMVNNNEVYFTIPYTNHGPDTAYNVVIVDDYDTRLTFDSVVADSLPLGSYEYIENLTYSGAPHNVISFSSGVTLTPNQVEYITLKYTVDNAIGTGQIINNAKIGVPMNLGELGGLIFLDSPFNNSDFYNGEVEANNPDDAVVELAPSNLDRLN